MKTETPWPRPCPCPPPAPAAAPARGGAGAGTTSPEAAASSGSGAGRSLLLQEVEGLLYRLDAPPRRHGRRSVVEVRLSGGEVGPPLVDRVDLYSFRSRRSFAELVASVFGREPGAVLGHLALVLDELERAAQAAEEHRSAPPLLGGPRRRAAEELLQAPDVLDKAAAAMDGLGYVGEERTKRLSYLVATSRLLPKPLSAILMAPSGAGKSELLEVLARLLPEDAVELLSRLTPQALYYAGADHLCHKLVLVDEQQGATEADYSIRTLQSRGVLRLAVPVKGRTEPFTVRGPISLMSSTTSETLNPENLSRCLELVLDDSPEQTRRIQEAQRRAWAGELGPPPDVGAWQDAQRLLEPLPVVIPFAPRLGFASRTTADRRGNQKLLGLVAAHALLCQARRERDQGRVVATSQDYGVVHDLLRADLEGEVQGLSPRAARVQRLLARSGAPLSRREVASRLGWHYATAARALLDLRAQELVRVVERGVPERWRLVEPATALGSAAVLTPPQALEA